MDRKTYLAVFTLSESTHKLRAERKDLFTRSAILRQPSATLCAMLDFEWDEHNRAHLARHGVTPEEAEQVIQNGAKEVMKDLRTGELRITKLGETDAKRVLLVVLTYRNGRMRMVSAWPAKKKFRAYWATIRKD